MIYELSTVLKFGKYKGKTIEQVLNNDPTYIRWCLENIDWFEMPKIEKETALEYAHQADIEKYEDDYMVIDIYDFCD